MKLPRLPNRRRLVVVSFLAGAGLLLVVLGILAARVLAPSSVAVEEVRKGRFVREVSATGAFKAVEATPIVVPTDSENPEKIAWMAIDGSRVKKEDPVVAFDPSEAQKNLADGQADRKTAVNKIEKTTAENQKTSRGLALDVDLAREQMTQAESFASKDPSIYSRNEIVTSEIDRGLLKTKLDAAEFKKGASTKLGDADIALGEIERSKADMRIRQAEKGLRALRVLAPHDGLIVFERNWRGEMLSVGETVFPGQKIAEIPDLSSLEAKVFVLEADAGGLKPGLEARVTIEGRPGVEYKAKVGRVDAMAKTRNYRVPTKYFETILTLERTDAELMKPGQAVSARIVLEQIPDAVAIPLGAVFEKDGKRIVYKQDGRRFTPAEVTVGHQSLSRVVIEKGLSPGDRIALRDPSRSAAEIFRSAGKDTTSGSGGGGGAPPDED
jgi:RND family efflux transporter MFP subunit